MNKGNILILFIILLITFFVSFLAVSEKKLYFSLNGNNYLELNIGEEYKEDGFKAEYCNKYIKLFCKDISDEVKVSKNYKDNKLFLNYIINKKENSVLTREIVYVDNESPTILLNNDDITMCPNQEYVEYGYLLDTVYPSNIQ